MTRHPRRLVLAFVCLTFVLTTGLVGCTVESARATPKAAAPTNAPSEEAKASPTEGFRVELPTTATPTQAMAEGTALPTATAGPTKTPRPTKTPWPTTAPTSAPIDDPNMVYVEGGEFIFGADSDKKDESPQQTLYVDGFNIDVNPVTSAEYKVFVDATGHRAPRNWKEGQIPAGKEDHPVVWVTWEDATAYAEWAGKRLPTEAEWEKAARGTDGRTYPWGDAFDSGKCNSREANIGKTSPVGQFPEGASAYGALDMAGNVWEWRRRAIAASPVSCLARSGFAASNRQRPSKWAYGFYKGLPRNRKALSSS